MFNDLTAIILAAGDSTRLWPIPDKLFLEFRGLPLIQYSLNQLKNLGINNFIIVANKNNFVSCSNLISLNSAVSLKVVRQTETQGMAGAVLAASNEIKTEKILVVGPTDIVEDYLMADFKTLYSQNPDGIFVGKKIDALEPLGYYRVDGNLVKNIVEKPKTSSKDSKIAAIVFDYFKNGNRLFEAIKNISSRHDDIYEQAKMKLIEAGLEFKLLPYNGYWGYLKYPWHVLSLTSYFLSNIKKTEIKKAKIEKNVKIIGNVVIEDNVKILEGVKIVGPAILGKGTIIGQNSLIRESIIGEHTIIGFNCEITRSFLGNNCWFHHNYVGDSVILNNVAFGFGAVVANYRLDGASVKSVVNTVKIDTLRTKLGVMIGESSRIGVNASLMPGIKIGKHAFIGSGVILSQDLPDNKFIEFQQRTSRVVDNRIKKNTGKIEENRLKLKF